MIERLLMTDLDLPVGLVPEPIVEVTPLAKTTFYAHFDKNTLQIKSISSKAEPAEGDGIAALNDEVGEALILGTASIFSYEIIALRNGTFEMIKKDGMSKLLDRVDVVRVFYEVVEDEAYRPIEMTVIPEEDIIEIRYDGDLVQESEAKFYFTRFNDPSFLKCTLQLDVNTLHQIALVNQTSEWPNPIRLKIDNVSDLSVFGIKGQTKASIKCS